MQQKTDGIYYLEQPGKNLSWSKDSGVTLIRQD